MKKHLALMILPLALLFTQCKESKKETTTQFIPQAAADSTVAKLAAAFGEAAKPRIERGVKQVASLWTEKDGTIEEFQALCTDYFVGDPDKLSILFSRLTDNYEALFGRFNMISLDLKRGMHLSIGEMLNVDEIFGAYEPGAHFNDDFFANKIAFITVMNFPRSR
jgi:hypothetical protein